MAQFSPQEQRHKADWDKQTNQNIRDKQRLAATAAVVGADQLNDIQSNEALRQNYQQRQTANLLAGQQPDDQYKNAGGWRAGLKAFNQERTAKDKNQRRQDRATAKDRHQQQQKNSKTVSSALTSASRGAQLATGRILQVAWLSALETLGLTLLYVAFHITMYKIGGIFSAIFMQPGQEWFMGAKEFLDEAQKSDGANEALSAEADILEKGETCACCLGCGLLSLIVLFLIAMIYLLLSCEGQKVGVQVSVDGTTGDILGTGLAAIRSLLPSFAGGCF